MISSYGPASRRKVRELLSITVATLRPWRLLPNDGQPAPYSRQCGPASILTAARKLKYSWILARLPRVIARIDRTSFCMNRLGADRGSSGCKSASRRHYPHKLIDELFTRNFVMIQHVFANVVPSHVENLRCDPTYG
jgi:hypothetical protein